MEAAAVTVMDYALTKLGHGTSDIFIVGKSIGSFPAVSLCAQPFAATIRGLLLISPHCQCCPVRHEHTNVPGFFGATS